MTLWHYKINDLPFNAECCVHSDGLPETAAEMAARQAQARGNIDVDDLSADVEVRRHGEQEWHKFTVEISVEYKYSARKVKSSVRDDLATALQAIIDNWSKGDAPWKLNTAIEDGKAALARARGE